MLSLNRHDVMPRRSRRALVAALYAGLFGFGVVNEVVAGSENYWWLLLGLPLFILFLFGLGVLSATRYHALFNGKRKDVDERDVSIRNDAYRVAYQLVSFMVIGYFLLADRFFEFSDSNRIVAVFVLLTLPMAVHAWLEPDLPTEETSFRTSSGAH